MCLKLRLSRCRVTVGCPEGAGKPGQNRLPWRLMGCSPAWPEHIVFQKHLDLGIFFKKKKSKGLPWRSRD